MQSEHNLYIQVAEEYPVLHKYQRLWPITSMIQTYLQNQRRGTRRRIAKAFDAKENPRQPLPHCRRIIMSPEDDD